MVTMGVPIEPIDIKGEAGMGITETAQTAHNRKFTFRKSMQTTESVKLRLDLSTPVFLYQLSATVVTTDGRPVVLCSGLVLTKSPMSAKLQ